MWKPILIIIIIFAALGYGYKYYTTPTVTETTDKVITTTSKPFQSNLVRPKKIDLTIKDLNVSLEPVALYQISAKLLAKKRYVDGWAGKLAPYDLVLGWRNAAIMENIEHLPITQSVRYYQYIVSPAANMTSSYVIEHTSNNHIIPANKNIRKAINSIKVNENVRLEGSLVNMTGTFKSNDIKWLTSTSRTDTGDSASELFYVTSVQIGEKVYK